MPFLRLTRDRRGFENTFLLHADHPGARPRLLYWYRTAPGIVLGRPALDEDAIRTIEENHPEIEFDWPAILALSEVMTPEDEPAFTPARSPARSAPNRRKHRDQRREGVGGPRDVAAEENSDAEVVEGSEPEGEPGPLERVEPVEPPQPAVSDRSLVEQLAGREVARALRSRYAEIRAKIDAIDGDRGAWLSRVEAINPDSWLTPEAVLHGVSNAGAAYDKLKSELTQVR